MKLMAAFLLTAWVGLGAQSPAAPPPVLDNERVIAWDLTTPGGLPDAKLLPLYDWVVVSIQPPAMHGKVEFIPKGAAAIRTLEALRGTRIALIGLKDHPATALENRSGYPDGFPRRGAVKKTLPTDKVTVWDFAFALDEPGPIHFHTKDVVVVSLGDGRLLGATPDGQKSFSEYPFGTIRFRPRDRTHNETLVKGYLRLIAVELN